MFTLVLRREHVNSLENMATAEYHRGHGTLLVGTLFGPVIVVGTRSVPTTLRRAWYRGG